jgi:hypothetical protein
MKSDVDPMQSAHAAPRCEATSKRSGDPCRAPAVKGWSVCRMHGARGGSQGDTAHPNYRHGLRSQGFNKLRKLSMQLLAPRGDTT